MRSIRLIWVGKTQDHYLRNGINVYMKKLSHYIKIDFYEIKPAQYSSGTANKWRRQDTENMIKKMDPSELNIFLDENGKQHSSKGLARCFEKQISHGISRANFFIGGAHGIDKSILPSTTKDYNLFKIIATTEKVKLEILQFKLRG